MASEKTGERADLFRLAPEEAALPPNTPLQPGQALREGGSLSSYIAERLHQMQEKPGGRTEGLFDVTTPAEGAFLPEPGMPLAENFNPFGGQVIRQAGYRINQTDRELVSGLEPLLPTAGIRLRVMRNRLTQEIAQLEARLNKYYKLEEASPAFQTRITLLENRLVLLRHQEQRVNGYMNQLFANGAFLFRLEALALGVQLAWADWHENCLQPATRRLLAGLGRLLRQPRWEQRQAVRALNDELAELQSLLQECLDSPATQSGELDVLLARYDQKARMLSQLLGHTDKK
ncbi:MAG: hypothetical protein AB7P76_05495 [Candidatus Melainabacteria bacterium]